MKLEETQASLPELFERHRPWLLAVVRGRLHPQLRRRVGSEDVVQEVYLLADRRFEAFRESGVPPRVWLFGLACECIKEHWERHAALKRNVARDCFLPENSSDHLAAGLYALLTSPSLAAARSEERILVRAVVERLGQNDQEILWLYHRDGLSFPEIADLLKLPLETARRRHRTALERFERLWKRAHP